MRLRLCTTVFALALITLDIGPNDLFRGGGVPAITTNLPVILAALREAAGPGVPIIGMNFYDPFLAPVWFSNPAGLGTEIAQAVGLNGVFDAIYAAAGIPVADVETAFQTTVTTPFGGVPLNVTPDLRLDVDVRAGATWSGHSRERRRLSRDRARIRQEPIA